MNSFTYNLIQGDRILKEGGTILYPTDTIWGIGCDATNEAAVRKVFKIKERPAEKSMILLVSDESEISQYVNNPDPEIFAYLKKTEKPTTVIYHHAKNLASNLIGKDGTVAIRICKDEFCKQLIRSLGKPIVSTSANISGLSSPVYFNQVSPFIKNKVDYIVTYRQDDEHEVQPSSVIKWDNGQVIVLRT
ncbi:MAG: threonylcarbamoyl-AMP synthase [Bacteroidetes bacterium]|nr:threonylcarbamoyl-AMP synthase [Bacteroidota bacterium]